MKIGGRGSSSSNKRLRIKMNDFDDPASKKKRVGGDIDASDTLAKANYEQSRLEQVLEEAVDKLTRCKFPNAPFKHSGYPFGNPFAVRLERHGNVVPDEYFDVIKDPCDLAKIKERVRTGYYTSFKMFETDVKLIIKNSYDFHQGPTLMAKLTKHFENFSKNVLGSAKSKLLSQK
uniref:Bromo domain-containing protein n=2 Tax=Mucochytrium quahogii TaxID=96639 RepID=A0A7S2SLI0_9STRA|mmetsp:Transcript_308/g.575  ORF Transcript_308/g.575 Transcript_308/m.575 type:complete len:175 (+) Transcript_308:387-911(+)